MTKKQTGISIDQKVYDEAKEFTLSQRPAWNFSQMVQIALEDFLANRKKQNLALPHPSQKKKAPQPKSTIEKQE